MGLLGVILDILGVILDLLGFTLGFLGRSWGSPGALSGASGEPLGRPKPSRRPPAPELDFRSMQGVILAPFWDPPDHHPKNKVFVWRVLHLLKKIWFERNIEKQPKTET